MDQPRSKLGQWLSPLVYLSNNVLSFVGVVLVTTAAVLWILLLPTLWSGTTQNPYMGILVFLALPTAFITGLILIPLGIIISRRRKERAGAYPHDFPPVDLRNVEFRRLLGFIAATTIINVIIAGQLTYAAVGYMDSVEFCGKTCHTVMQPEFTAYQNSPHARVECVKCHIGPGADWFVRSKLSGVGQVFAVAFNTYPRPIPTPVRNLRPARETCETCHWPQKFGGDRLRVIDKFADDEQNTHSKTVLLMRIGGGNAGAIGIHGVHLGPGVEMRYAPADESRQTIPVVEYTKGDGKWIRYVSSEAKPADVERLTQPENMRIMDCMDCHNRPSHTFQLPERAMDNALASGAISPALPFAKKTGLELLKTDYATQQQAADAIARGFERFYQTKYPEVYARQRDAIRRSAAELAHIYGRNVFPEMNVRWGGYPNNLGHTDFPGCFRCHDGMHAAASGESISQDCSSCHSLLAMEESNPKVLSDLGVADAAPPPPHTSTQ
jgi:nitrate/TMAO reductase-like tetraheme cytochrome c subunit